jgi:hypothetical protein
MEREDRRNGCHRGQTREDCACNPAWRRRRKKKKYEAGRHEHERHHFEKDGPAPAPPIRGQRLVISI